MNFPSRHSTPRSLLQRADNGEFTFRWLFPTAMLLSFLLYLPALIADEDILVDQRAAFEKGWNAARQGDRAQFRQSLDNLQDYRLYPYLQYEDLRYRRGTVAASEMSDFIEQHRSWAFTPGLEKAWLRALGDRGRWESVLEFGGISKDTEVQCHFANARIQRGLTDGLEPVAQSLWAAGKSQPDACDPVFSWLKKQGGISTGLAWQRFSLAMKARERKLARYVVRFMDKQDQVWADRWLQQDRGGYRQLNQASRWPDAEKTRDIALYGLGRLARNDPDRAWEIFDALDGNVTWPEAVRGGMLADLALWSAVGRSPETGGRMQRVPEEYRNDGLFEWWARYQLTQADWDGVVASIAAMSPELRDDSRWLYWDARARLEAGRTDEGQAALEQLAQRANYYGFLAADHLDLPYAICPEQPAVTDAETAALLGREGIERALELRRAGLSNWARSEWSLVVRDLDNAGLRAAASVATRENWPDMAITALGNSGDLRWYEWRFPLGYAGLASSQAEQNGLDSSWVLGLMRSESALAADAISHAGARGLMQITPNTAARLARRHGFSYGGRAELLEPEKSVRFGTAYLGELLDRYAENPVLATGAYNAGPGAVDRWIADGYTGDPAVWIDTLPYFETRDYIPRVLAFSTIYEWRMDRAVKRVSSRMPEIVPDGQTATAAPTGTAGIACSPDG